jgi:hypothetical protein
MSGAQSFSQVKRWSTRCLIELTFQVAIRIRRVLIGNHTFSLLWHTTRFEAVITV